MRVSGRERAVRNESDNNGHRGWERQNPDWVGRVGRADMAGKRPLCVLGPMMSALILSPFDLCRIFDFSSRRRNKSEVMSKRVGDCGSPIHYI